MRISDWSSDVCSSDLVDLRRPAQHRAFGLSNDEGMSDLLTSHREVGSVIRTTDVANLSFIPAGPIPPSPTELLGSPRLVAVLDELRGNFDDRKSTRLNSIH